MPRAQSHLHLITDAVAEMEWWAAFNPSGGLRKPRRVPRSTESPVSVEAALPVRAPKVGRNDPCPCGSGKKYKRCCGNT